MKCKLLVIRNVFNLSDTSKLAEFFYKFTYIMLLYIPFCCYLYADRLYYIYYKYSKNKQFLFYGSETIH